jgi:hypothetical protein
VCRTSETGQRAAGGRITTTGSSSVAQFPPSGQHCSQSPKPDIFHCMVIGDLQSVVPVPYLVCRRAGDSDGFNGASGVRIQSSPFDDDSLAG